MSLITSISAEKLIPIFQMIESCKDEDYDDIITEVNQYLIQFLNDSRLRNKYY